MDARMARTLGLVVGIILGSILPACVGGGGPGAALAAESGDGPTPGQARDPDYAAGVQAIEKGNFAAAVRHLEIVVSKDGATADAYNWLGYAVRRNGDPARSIPIYEKALALDPKHKGAHEYIGEAYLALDNLPKAKEHLARLDKLCFFPCSEYTDLKKAVQAYEQSGGKVKPGGK